MASNLEVCIAIIQLLNRKGPQTPGKIEISIITKADNDQKMLGPPYRTKNNRENNKSQKPRNLRKHRTRQKNFRIL